MEAEKKLRNLAILLCGIGGLAIGLGNAFLAASNTRHLVDGCGAVLVVVGVIIALIPSRRNSGHA
jgi:hypothetical protein